MKKSKIVAAIVAILLPVFGLSMLPAPTYAAANVCTQLSPDSPVYKANGCGGETTDLKTVIVNIINGVVGSIALVAVIFIIVGGVNYMTSAGDTNKLQKAKNTILYAVIGLIIAVLSFAIVNFVIVKILGDGGEGNTTEVVEENED